MCYKRNSLWSQYFHLGENLIRRRLCTKLCGRDRKSSFLCHTKQQLDTRGLLLGLPRCHQGALCQCYTVMGSNSPERRPSSHSM